MEEDRGFPITETAVGFIFGFFTGFLLDQFFLNDCRESRSGLPAAAGPGPSIGPRRVAAPTPAPAAEPAAFVVPEVPVAPAGRPPVAVRRSVHRADGSTFW